MIDGLAEDDLVSLDELQEKVQEFEDFVQSTDIAAMQSKYLFVSDYAHLCSIRLQSCKTLLSYPSSRLLGSLLL